MNSFIPLWPAQASKHAANVDALIAAFTVLIVLLAGPVFVLIFRVRGALPARQGRRPHARTEPERLDRSVVVRDPLLRRARLLCLGDEPVLRPRRLRRRTRSISTSSPSSGCGRPSTRAARREINELHVPVGQAGEAGHDHAGRDPQPLRAGPAHQAGRAAGPLHEDVVHGRQAGRVSAHCAEFCGTDHSLMRAEGLRDDGAGLRTVARAAGTPTRRSRRRARSCFASTAAAAATAPPRACRRRRWPGFTGAPSRSRTASVVTSRRAVHPRQHHIPAEAGRSRLQADHAALPQPAERRRRAEARGLHQIAQAGRLEARMTAASSLDSERASYLGDGHTHALLAPHHRPQAHRDPLSGLDHRVLLHRRCGGGADPARPADAGRPIFSRTKATTAPSRCTASIMVWFFLIPSIPATLRQLPHPADDRRARPRASRGSTWRAGTSTSSAGSSCSTR